MHFGCGRVHGECMRRVGCPSGHAGFLIRNGAARSLQVPAARTAAAGGSDGVERTARGRGNPFLPRVGGPRTLEELVSLMAVLEAASIITDVYSG